MATIDEIADDIFRVNIVIPGPPVTFSFFVIRDEQPALVETGFRGAFSETWQAVRRIIDPATLRYIVVPHFEGDECGALNHFLERAPAAAAVGSPIAMATSLPDFAIRQPLGVNEDTALNLGRHSLRFLVTPYVHQWDSMLAYDTATRTLFSSDVFISPGAGPAVSDHDETEQMLDIYRQVGLFPSRAHLDAALDKIQAIAPTTLACHHGSVKTANVDAYLHALRANDITGVTAWNPMRESTATSAPPPD